MRVLPGEAGAKKYIFSQIYVELLVLVVSNSHYGISAKAAVAVTAKTKVLNMTTTAKKPNPKLVALEHATSRNQALVSLLTPITAEDLQLGDNGTLDTVIECPKLDWSETLNSEWADNLRTDDFNIDFELALAEFQDELEEERITLLNEYGLSFEATNLDLTTGTATFEYMFSWGGPSETLRFSLLAGGDDTTPFDIEFVFKDWFECVVIDCDYEQFKGLSDFAYMLAEFAKDLVYKKLDELGLAQNTATNFQPAQCGLCQCQRQALAH